MPVRRFNAGPAPQCLPGAATLAQRRHAFINPLVNASHRNGSHHAW
jgi:hypothetical protein